MEHHDGRGVARTLVDIVDTQIAAVHVASLEGERSSEVARKVRHPTRGYTPTGAFG